MSRVGIACLFAVSILIVVNRNPAPDTGTATLPRAEGIGIRARLGEWNPELSADQKQRIAASLSRCTQEQGLAPELVAAVIRVESGARPWVRSRKGAIGLMQVMPHMVEDMDLAGNLTTIEKNIEAGCLILADNIRRLGEDDGISAYFWGSDIRGVAYLSRVKQARAGLTRLPSS
ncbi:MAG: lytic transglycosylase domain-containing protein [Myxococcota bacterium]